MESKFSFEDLKFREFIKDGENFVRGDFYRNYYFDIPFSALESIAPFRVEGGALFFDCSEKKAWNKLSIIIDNGMNNLFHKVRNKPTIYVYEDSGIPLMGSNEFGLVDRGSNIIEVKPLTGCNLSCIFCSVSEGINDKIDVLVEEEYLVSEFKKLAAIKKHPVEANIGPQGEPLLYPKLLELIRDLKSIPNVSVISINTNGLTLNEKFIDELAAAGLDRINLSLHALDKKLASELADGPYNLDQILKAIKLCEGKIDVLLAPVVIPGRNEQEMPKIVELSKTIKNKRFPTIGVQNYLNYKGGRNIAKQMEWDDFFTFLKELEKNHDVKLILTENVFRIEKDETLPKPFRKGQVVKVSLVSRGRRKNEALGVASNRVITVIGSPKIKGELKVRLLRDKHNVFTAIPA